MSIPDINIFLDTTLLDQDPFFKFNFNRLLLKFSEVYGIPLYISQVVFDETRNRYSHHISERIKDLEKALDQLRNYHPNEINTSTIEFSHQDLMNQFDTFYKDLIEKEIIKIIEYDNNILPELVRRSIHRIKPFSEKKQEFRDAITWLTYVQIVEEKNMEHCFFITNNIKDFYQDNAIHPDIKNDSNRFKLYRFSKDFLYNEELIIPLIKTVEVEKWLDENPINEEGIEAALEKELFDDLYDYTYDFANEYGVIHDDGYGEVYGIDIDEVKDIHVEVISDEVIITGSVIITAAYELYLYNSYRDLGEDHYKHVGSDEAQFEFIFSFSYTTEKKIEHFEIDDKYILSIANRYD